MSSVPVGELLAAYRPRSRRMAVPWLPIALAVMSLAVIAVGAGTIYRAAHYPALTDGTSVAFGGPVTAAAFRSGLHSDPMLGGPVGARGVWLTSLGNPGGASVTV